MSEYKQWDFNNLAESPPEPAFMEELAQHHAARIAQKQKAKGARARDGEDGEDKEEEDFLSDLPSFLEDSGEDDPAPTPTPRSRRKSAAVAKKATNTTKSKKKGSEQESQEGEDEADEAFGFQSTPAAKSKRAPKAAASTRKGSKTDAGAAAARGRGRARKPKDDDEDDGDYKPESKKANSQKKKTTAGSVKRGGSATGVTGRKRKATSPPPAPRRHEDEQDEDDDEEDDDTSSAISEPRSMCRRITSMRDIDGSSDLMRDEDEDDATPGQIMQRLKSSKAHARRQITQQIGLTMKALADGFNKEMPRVVKAVTATKKEQREYAITALKEFNARVKEMDAIVDGLREVAKREAAARRQYERDMNNVPMPDLTPFKADLAKLTALAIANQANSRPITAVISA